jgi:hypothetical protein
MFAPFAFTLSGILRNRRQVVREFVELPWAT